MKNNYFIGLGGSGGQVITALYRRLIKERGESFRNHVECIAIDTDQGDLRKLEELGVQKICLSGRGSVGEYFNLNNDDVGIWFPNTAVETVTFSDKLDNGASQSRIKSRLMFASLLNDDRNPFYTILENTLKVSAVSENNASVSQTPIILIASSLAGGTGAGIFIQTALYVKEFFRSVGIQKVDIYGLFALPDLYVGKAQNPRNLYSNAYAAIRELNAFNLMCGPDETAAYGGKVELDIEISTKSEGKLFEKNDKGRYNYKPYDNMYFIDKVSSMSTIRGGLEEYYVAMADIAYTHLYTPIKEKIQSTESNETKNHIIAPTAIYGSSGATSAVYPFDDILKYFATRAIWESVEDPDAAEDDEGTVWNILDNKWNHYCATKETTERAKGIKYTPKPEEREAHFIRNFDSIVKSDGLTVNKFSFLAPMVRRTQNDIEENAVDQYITAVETSAKTIIFDDEVIKQCKEDLNVDDLLAVQAEVQKNIRGISSDSTKDEDGVNQSVKSAFTTIKDIDDGFENFSKKCIKRISELSIEFSNRILCVDPKMAATFDKEEISIANGLLYNNDTGEWAHPVATRYLLYSLRQKMDSKISEILEAINNTPADDATDFHNHLMASLIADQRKTLNPTKDDKEVAPLSNYQVLLKMYDKKWNGKKHTKKSVETYFDELDKTLAQIDANFEQALLLFSYARAIKRVEGLIKEYETFFDNLGTFATDAKKKTDALANYHDKAHGVIYVCASAKIKNLMYESAKRYIDTQSGEVASEIARALFVTERTKAMLNSEENKKNILLKYDLKYNVKTPGDVLDMMAGIIGKSFEANPQIQMFNKNIFDAMLYEYELNNPGTEDVKNMGSHDGAALKITRYIAETLNNMALVAAPALNYNNIDMHHALFKHEDVTRPEVSVNYRFIAHNSTVAQSIAALCGDANKIDDFYQKCSEDMVKDKGKKVVHAQHVVGDSIPDNTILFYSAVNCLQPYQIDKFNETTDGKYFVNYASTIDEMERTGSLSMTPHLDKRWHKHGMMPYINVQKERDRRRELAKAFIFALAYSKIGYEKNGSDTRFVFQDPKMTPAIDPEIIVYKGRSVQYNKANRVMRWFENQDSLISLYASKLDMAIEADLEICSRSDNSVQTYDAATTMSKLLKRIRENIISPILVSGTKSGKDKKSLAKEKNMGAFGLAWEVHSTEENDFDKDHGELIIEAVCDIIKRYAKEPYNKEEIENKKEGSDSYSNYVYVRNHIATKFMEAYYDSLYGEKKQKNGANASATATTTKAKGKQKNDDTSEGLSDTFVQNTVNKETSLDLSEFDGQNKGLEWVKATLARYIED